ncbi:MAG: ATP-binding cassette domain-containing protein [Eubacterium sp.]|nr:ATP-binding cassette domain-containing protein [Eubacterium sp.]
MSIELKSVSYTYAPNTNYQTQSLDNINLTISDGEFVGIMGQTGCGKSTLIQLIDGLLVPDQGSVLLDGQDINNKKYDRSILRKNIGLVFQLPEYQLFETTVERDIAFVLKHSHLSKDEIKSRVIEALNSVGFDYDKIRGKSPLSFSGGEKKRLAIAGVLASEPKILIFDEPIAGLDYQGRTTFLKLIKELNENGITIIMISHDSNVMAEYASRIILMDNGRIICDGSAETVLSDCEMLNQIGAGTSEAVSVSNMLRQRGVEINSDTVKYGQLLDEISRIYGGADI